MTTWPFPDQLMISHQHSICRNANLLIQWSNILQPCTSHYNWTKVRVWFSYCSIITHWRGWISGCHPLPLERASHTAMGWTAYCCKQYFVLTKVSTRHKQIPQYKGRKFSLLLGSPVHYVAFTFVVLRTYLLSGLYLIMLLHYYWLKKWWSGLKWTYTEDNQSFTDNRFYLVRRPARDCFFFKGFCVSRNAVERVYVSLMEETHSTCVQHHSLE